MARFLGIVQGKGKEIHRLGHSGIVTEANGWHLGVTVEGERGDGDDHDIFSVYVTGGSGRNEKRLILSVWDDNMGSHIKYHGEE